MEVVGLGCFWFARRASTTNVDERPSEHLKHIKLALESVDNVSNVVVTGEGKFTFDPDDEGESENYYPIYGDVVLTFNIFVPERLQRKYTLDESIENVNNFHVLLCYERTMPVAYVHYTVQSEELRSGDFSPSTAVVFIRKYLAEKLEHHPTVEFQCLGPSPFHADILLAVPRQKDGTTTAKDLSSAGQGYRTLYFPTKSNRPDAAVAQFVDEYHPLLSTFYSAVRRGNLSRRLRAKVINGAVELMEPIRTANPWKRLQHWRGYRPRIDAVFESLLAEKMNRVEMSNFCAELRQDEEIDPANLFFRFIEGEIRPLPEFPDEDIRELLIMLEERRRGYFQNTATLFAGLAGGILGAALGAALGAPSGPGAERHASPSPAVNSSPAAPALPR
jgi:hypothetical protein